MSDKLFFQTNSHLKSIIGKDLITDDNLAVLELIKNSFDSGSPFADIYFNRVTVNGPIKIYRNENISSILIHDGGSGMSFEDIKNKWLNIAYSEKKDSAKQYGRNLAGNKGVGRFSCDKLGKLLTIYTSTDTSGITKVDIDWRDFEGEAKVSSHIQDVPLSYELNYSLKKLINNTGVKEFVSGTILHISSLREEWNREKILNLRRDLEKFINPNQEFDSEKFKIRVFAKEFKSQDTGLDYFEKVNGKIQNKIFEKLDFKSTSINSSISVNGDIIETKLYDRGRKIFTLKEVNPYPLLKDVDITIYYLNPYSKAYFTKQTGTRSVDFGSVFLFINGFRVPPYGDRGDDWLGMDIRKNQGTTRFLGSREVIGRIEIKNNNEQLSDDEEYFKIISNRSGVVNNSIFQQLTENEKPYGFFYKTFRRLEKFVVEGIRWDSTSHKNYRLVEKEVLEDPNWSVDKEQYKISSLERDKNVVGVIENIVNVPKGSLINLEIHKKFLNEIIQEQTEKINSDIEKLVHSISERELSPSELSSFLNQLKNSQSEVSDFSRLVTGLNVDRSSLSNIEIKLNDRINAILKERDDALRRLEKEKVARKNIEQSLDEVEQKLEAQKAQNIYLLSSSRSLSEDAKGLIHNIKITSKAIGDTIDNLYDDLSKKENIDKNKVLQKLAAIKFQSEKALKITSVITRSNFKTDQTSQIVNIGKYIEEYIGLYSEIYNTDQITFNIEPIIVEVHKKISLLDMTVVFDNLISNSIKAKANNIFMDVTQPDANSEEIHISFIDDGVGILPEFINNKNSIFELGVTTTEGGSGIGLRSVRSALSNMGGNINLVGNDPVHGGAKFLIEI